jgi:Asp-tRNA(Asn)/Glu-tRNA(Gln) amidotransferase C subunit
MPYIKVLDELDTSNIEETHHVTGAKNVSQAENTKNQTLTLDEALQNGSNIDNLFATEGVFENRGA